MFDRHLKQRRVSSATLEFFNASFLEVALLLPRLFLVLWSRDCLQLNLLRSLVFLRIVSYPSLISFMIAIVEIPNKAFKLDLERKLVTYARDGIIEYWVIELVNKKLVVHTQPVGNCYTRIQNLTTANISPQTFRELAI